MLNLDNDINGVILGIDEVGRGSLIGPVIVAGVIIKSSLKKFKEVNDSKKLSIIKREKLNTIIKDNAYCYFASSNVAEIEEVNILQATLLAMRRIIKQVQKNYDHVLVDGIHSPDKTNKKIILVPGGDSKSLSIAAASIIAKVKRDAIMKKFSKKYKEYHWHRNMGYGTQEHITAIKKYGPSPYHRLSFLKKII